MLRGVVISCSRSAAAGACLVFASTASWTNPDQLARGVSDFKAASRQIVALFETVQDPATAGATAPRVRAATASRNQAEAEIQAAMQDMDPNNRDHSAQIQRVYREIQAANQAVANAKIQATARQTAAGTRQ
jgi:hypothetical protein